MDSDLRQNHTKEVGPLVGASSDQEPAVASTLRDQLARRRPFLVDEELGARLEVVKHVLLVAHGAGVAPRGAVLAPAAEVGDGDDAAIAQSKDGARDGEGRFQGDVEACCIGVDGGEGGRVAREKEREIVRERLKRKKERKEEQAKQGGRSVESLFCRRRKKLLQRPQKFESRFRLATSTGRVRMIIESDCAGCGSEGRRNGNSNFRGRKSKVDDVWREARSERASE